MDKTPKKPAEQEPKPAPAEQETKYCGIVMPIASMLPNYEASHWSRVKAILERAIEKAGFVPRLVSDADEIGVIHGRIVQNLYDDQIVVCDVSGRNPNVMFELGMRLAFDKPTIIVKDDETSYSFDTQVIEHIPYRKDLRYDDVEHFSDKLTAMITNTVEKKQKDPDFSPFLGHFAKRMKPKKLESEEISGIEFIVDKLNSLESRIASISGRNNFLQDQIGNIDSYHPRFIYRQPITGIRKTYDGQKIGVVEDAIRNYRENRRDQKIEWSSESVISELFDTNLDLKSIFSYDEFRVYYELVIDSLFPHKRIPPNKKPFSSFD